jgi:hypothetical protein
MTLDDIVAELDAIETRIDLIAFLAPLRVSPNLDETELARLTAALIAATSRCMKLPA